MSDGSVVFVCYSHEDEKWLIKGRLGIIPWLQKQFKSRGVEFWWDNETDQGLRGGDEWRARIFDAIDRADLAILLVSDSFAASEFVREQELPRIKARYERKELGVLPVLVSTISKMSRDDLSWPLGLQVIPSEQKALINFTPNEWEFEAERSKLADEINYRIQEQLKNRATAQALERAAKTKLALPAAPPKPAIPLTTPPPPVSIVSLTKTSTPEEKPVVKTITANADSGTKPRPVAVATPLSGDAIDFIKALNKPLKIGYIHFWTGVRAYVAYVFVVIAFGFVVGAMLLEIAKKQEFDVGGIVAILVLLGFGLLLERKLYYRILALRRLNIFVRQHIDELKTRQLKSFVDQSINRANAPDGGSGQCDVRWQIKLLASEYERDLYITDLFSLSGHLLRQWKDGETTLFLFFKLVGPPQFIVSDKRLQSGLDELYLYHGKEVLYLQVPIGNGSQSKAGELKIGAESYVL